MDEDLSTRYYSGDLRNVMASKYPFRTKNNAMGVGPENVTAGDVICHLTGHNFLFVLHPESDHYVARGECYIPGIQVPEVTEDVLSTMQEFEVR